MTQIIYLCGPIGGHTFEEANVWRENVSDMLIPMQTLSPLRSFPDGLVAFGNPDTTPNSSPYLARFERDYDDVMRCDALFVNFIGAKRKSIGSAMEIAWARALDKIVVVAMEDGNVNEDLFLEHFIDCHGWRLPTIGDAINKMRTHFGHPEYDIKSSD